MNMWIYINDYNYKYGEPKYVLMKGSTNKTEGLYYASNPGIYLDPTRNDLIINVELQSGTELDDSSAPSSSDDVSFAIVELTIYHYKDGFV